MMKDSLAALVGALLITHGTLALAASAVDLSVKGAITPSACTPSLSEGGVVDYGKISVKDLRPTGATELPKFIFELKVDCEAQALFAIKTHDNRPERPQAVHPSMYGLGVINGDELVGRISWTWPTSWRMAPASTRSNRWITDSPGTCSNRERLGLHPPSQALATGLQVFWRPFPCRTWRWT